MGELFDCADSKWFVEASSTRIYGAIFGDATVGETLHSAVATTNVIDDVGETMRLVRTPLDDLVDQSMLDDLACVATRIVHVTKDLTPTMVVLVLSAKQCIFASISFEESYPIGDPPQM